MDFSSPELRYFTRGGAGLLHPVTIEKVVLSDTKDPGAKALGFFGLNVGLKAHSPSLMQFLVSSSWFPDESKSRG